jgi:hypothetical protein
VGVDGGHARIKIYGGICGKEVRKGKGLYGFKRRFACLSSMEEREAFMGMEDVISTLSLCCVA